MSNDQNMRDLPIVPITGSDSYVAADLWAKSIEAQFPGQDAYDFANACLYNEYGPAEKGLITNFQMVKQGYNDGSDWIWVISFADDSIWAAVGGCDYTGWDCQSGLNWTQLNFLLGVEVRCRSVI